MLLIKTRCLTLSIPKAQPNLKIQMHCISWLGLITVNRHLFSLLRAKVPS